MVKIIQDEYNDQGKELRDHGTVAFPAACYSGDWKSVSVPLHWHGELEAGFVTSGQVTVFVGKERMVLEEGEGFFINSGIPHAFARGEGPDSSQRSVVFDPSIVGGRIDSVYWKRYVQPVLAAASMPWVRFQKEEGWQKQVLDSVTRAWELCHGETAEYELEVRSCLTTLLVQLRQHLPPEQPAQSRRILRDNERIRAMMGFIQAHFDQELTTSAIAASAMISVSECLRCFHACIGMTPIQYVKHYRIQQAAEKIANTDRRIAQIASECGFQEMSYFAKSFREVLGVTPSQYRKAGKTGEGNA